MPFDNPSSRRKASTWMDYATGDDARIVERLSSAVYGYSALIMATDPERHATVFVAALGHQVEDLVIVPP